MLAIHGSNSRYASPQLAADLQHALHSLRHCREVLPQVRQEPGESRLRRQTRFAGISKRLAGSARKTTAIRWARRHVCAQQPEQYWTCCRKRSWALVRGAAASAGTLDDENWRGVAARPTKLGKFAGYNPHTQPQPAASPTRTLCVRRSTMLICARWRVRTSTGIRLCRSKPLGAQQVYDLTVPDGENFVAQDIFRP